MTLNFLAAYPYYFLTLFLFFPCQKPKNSKKKKEEAKLTKELCHACDPT